MEQGAGSRGPRHLAASIGNATQASTDADGTMVVLDILPPPYDVLLSIAQFLALRDLAQWTLGSNIFGSLVHSDGVWRKVFVRDYAHGHTHSTAAQGRFSHGFADGWSERLMDVFAGHAETTDRLCTLAARMALFAKTRIYLDVLKRAEHVLAVIG